MNYDERTKRIFDFLYNERDGILRRYKMPEIFTPDRARAEINDMVEDLNSHMPNCDKDKFMAILERFRVSLRQTASSRSWPTIPQCIRAINAAVEDSPSVGAITEDEIIEMLAKSFREGNGCIRHLGTEDLTRKVWVQHGFNLWDMRVAGFPMDRNLKLDMEKTPKGKKYLAYHYRVLAGIWGCSIEEAEARDKRNVERGVPDLVEIPDKRRVDNYRG